MADPDFIVTDSFMFKDIDLLTVKVSDLDFQTEFNFRSTKPTIMHGLASWFTVDFSSAKKPVNSEKEDKKKKTKTLVLSTSPFHKATHWKNTLFYLEKPLSLGYRQEIKGRIDVRKAPLNHREIDVDFQLQTDHLTVCQQYRIN